MDARFEKYLSTVDSCLKPLPTSERIDIVKEIKGSILEMEREGLATEQILERLGRPKDLAKAYLEDLLSSSKGFGWNRFLLICAFYSVVGFSGMIIIPVLGIVAPTFLFVGAMAPIISLIELLASFFGVSMPYDIVQFGSLTLPPAIEFVYSLVAGMLLILLGKGAWLLLLKYLKAVSRGKKDLSI